MYFTVRTPPGMKEVRVTLPKGGYIMSMAIVGPGEVRLRFGTTPLYGVYSGSNAYELHKIHVDLPTPGVMSVQVSGEAVAEITLRTEAQPIIQVIYDLEKAPYKPTYTAQQLRPHEQGPSAAEGAPGINPRKEPVSVGMSYTDDEIDALIVDAKRT